MRSFHPNQNPRRQLPRVSRIAVSPRKKTSDLNVSTGSWNGFPSRNKLGNPRRNCCRDACEADRMDYRVAGDEALAATLVSADVAAILTSTSFRGSSVQACVT